MQKLSGFIKRHIKEVVIIALLLFVGVLLLVLVNAFSVVGNTVVVSVDGEEYGEYSLFFDAEYDIGDGNIITVLDGEVYMSYADCPDKTCKNMGKISQVGEKIICLPNRVMVEIR